MQPFPPSIVNALLREPRHHQLNHEVRVLRERSERSRNRPRRRYLFRTGAWVSRA